MALDGGRRMCSCRRPVDIVPSASLGITCLGHVNGSFICRVNGDRLLSAVAWQTGIVFQGGGTDHGARVYKTMAQSSHLQHSDTERHASRL